MNGINAVLAPAAAPITTATTTFQSGAVTLRSNGSAAGHHHSNTATAANSHSNEGYAPLAGQGSSSSSCSSSSESDDHRRHTTKLSFPRGPEENNDDEEDISPCSSSAVLTVDDKTDCKRLASPNGLSFESCSSSSSLNLSHPNISTGQYTSDEFLYAVQSLEHDLDCILENRDLNPFYEDTSVAGGSKDQIMTPEEEEEECSFNVEDYLVDLDQYLDEQEQRIEMNPSDQNYSCTTLDRRILRQPDTNKTLPRNLREKNSALQRDSAIRSSVNLGKEPNGKYRVVICLGVFYYYLPSLSMR